MGFDGARGLLYQIERKPDLPVSRRVGSELSVRSLLNQLVYESTLCVPSVWRCPCWSSVVVNSALFMMRVINLRIYSRMVVGQVWLC